MRTKTKVRKTWNLLISLTIFVVTYGFIYYEIFYKRDFFSFLSAFDEITRKPGFWTSLVWIMLLMIVNWGIETKKWQYLISKIEQLSWIKAFQAVLTGVSVSTFTPNRIGDFVGRAFILEKGSHIEGILVTVLGSMSQLLVTILTGTVAYLISIPLFLDMNGILKDYLYYGLMTLVIFLDLLLLFLYFNISFLSVLREKIMRFRLRKYRAYLRVFSLYRFRELFVTLLLSILRYAVFSFQYYFLLKLFGVPISFPEGILLVSLIFFFVSVIPTVALTELGIRDSVALYFISLYLSKKGILDDVIPVGVLSATTLIWIINLAIPAIAGTFFVFRLKFFRRNNA
jgi:uncharacterized membrane protein YbhN (UPF0104 family)